MAEQAKPKISLPFLKSMPGELGKLTSAIEDDAREFVQKDIPVIHAKRVAVMNEARAKLHAGIGGALADVSGQLDEVLEALVGDNGAPKTQNPTSGGSSQSPDTKVE